MMNLYDTKSVHCKICGKEIGEIDLDAESIISICGKCTKSFSNSETLSFCIGCRDNSAEIPAVQ